MWPHNDWLSAYHIISFIDEMVLDKGRAAFAHNGHTHFYSGPSWEVLRNILGPYSDPKIRIRNHIRAKNRAKALNAVLIDDTIVGQYLENFKGIGSAIIKGQGTYDYFEEHPEMTDPSEVEQSKNLPWMHASRLFALAAWGHVSTTICGASPDRVTYSIEEPYILNTDHSTPSYMAPLESPIKSLFVPRPHPIEFVNLFPFTHIEKHYTPTDWKKAHKLMCLSEIRMARHDALQGIKPQTIRDGLKATSQEALSRPIETFQYFQYSQEAYRVDKDYMFKHTTAHSKKSKPVAPPAERQRNRQHTLKEFGRMALECVQAELAILPPDQRPAIPALSLLDGRMTLEA